MQWDIDAVQILMLQACFSFRICDATLEGRFYVWLPVPEWMQSSADPEMHRDPQEAACDHGYGRMQSGEEPDAGGGSEGTALVRLGSTCSFSRPLISKVCSYCLQPHLLSSGCICRPCLPPGPVEEL